MKENISKTTTKENEEERLIYLKKVAIINKYMRKNHPLAFENILIFGKNINVFMLQLGIIASLFTAVGLYSAIFPTSKPTYVYIVILIFPFLYNILIIKEHRKIKKNIKLLKNINVKTFDLINIKEFFRDIDGFYNIIIDAKGLCSHVYYNSSYEHNCGFTTDDSDFTTDDLEFLYYKIDIVFNSIVNKSLLFELDNFEKVNKIELCSFIVFYEDKRFLSYEVKELSRYYSRDVSLDINDFCFNNLIRFKIPNDSYDYIIENELNGEELVNYVKSVNY